MKFTTEERRLITFEKEKYPNLYELLKRRRQYVKQQMGGEKDV